MSFKENFKKFIYRFVNVFYRVEVIGADKEPDCGVLLCSNHISNLDPVLLVTSLKTQPMFMAKKELFKIPVISSFIKLFGAFPVERGSVDLTAMKKAISLLENGNTVGIFPQGTRYPGKNPKDTSVKRGVGMIVSRSCTDILPVAIITKNNKCKVFRKKFIVIGDVIKYDSLGICDKSKDEFDRISSVIFAHICDLYEKYSYLAEK